MVSIKTDCALGYKRLPRVLVFAAVKWFKGVCPCGGCSSKPAFLATPAHAYWMDSCA
jgi:hypothetical protein